MGKREKKIVVVWEKGLTDEQVRNYERDHPGYRLSFEMRHPDFPLCLSMGTVLFLIAVLVLTILLK